MPWKDDTQDDADGFTRRDLLIRVGIAGVAAAVPVTIALPDAAAQAPASPTRAAAPAREAFENLTAAEADTLEAIVERLIPSDANGPGAREARAAHYIDRALGGALAGQRQAYAAGLAALDRYARASRGAAFTELSAPAQDAVLTDVESGAAPPEIFSGGAAPFFAMVRTHTIQGTFCDPYYGGNANFVGWDLLGYPGVRTMVTQSDQRLGATLAPNHKSAYDFEMFNKATAKTVTPGAGDPFSGD